MYAVVNPRFPQLVKIGHAKSSGRNIKDLQERINGLFVTGVPCPYELCHAVCIEDCVKGERVLKTVFKNSLERKGREFYRDITIEQVRAATELWNTKHAKGLTASVRAGLDTIQSIEDDGTRTVLRDGGQPRGQRTEKPRSKKSRSAKARKPNSPATGKRKSIVNFQRDLKISVGKIITLKGYPAIRATVKGPSDVLFQRKKVKLSTATRMAYKKVGDSKFNWPRYRGIQHWEYNGKLLGEIFKQKSK